MGDEKNLAAPPQLKGPRRFGWLRGSSDEPHSPRPRRVSSRRLRIIEAMLALFCLLLFQQTFWLFMRTPHWASAAGPRSGIYLEARSSTGKLLNSGDASSTPVEVDQPSLFIQAHLPSDTSAGVFVNGVLRNQGEGGAFPLTAFVELRRGRNGIAVVPRKRTDTYQSEESPWWLYSESQRGWAQYPRTIVQYRPVNSLQPVIIGAFLSEDKTCEVLGLSEPDSHVYILAGGAPLEVKTDALGMFRYDLQVSSRETSLGVVTKQDAITSAIPVTVAEECRDTPAEKVGLERKIRIQFDDDPNELAVHLEARIPTGTALYEWISSKQISTPELLENVFGLQLVGFNPLVGQIASQEDKGFLRLVIDQSMRRPALVLDRQRWPILLTANDQITLVNAETQQFNTDRPPDFVSGQTRTWTGGAGKRLGRLLVQSIPTTLERRSSSSPVQRDEASLQAIAGQITQHIPAFARDILWALLTALPFIWLLKILGPNPYPDFPRYGSTLHAAAVAFLLFHLTTLTQPLFSFSLNFAERLPLERWLGFLGTDAYVYSRALSETLRDLGSTYPFLLIAISLLIRPIFRAYNGKRSTALQEGLGIRLCRWFVVWPIALILPLPLVSALFARYVAAQQTWRDTDLGKLFLEHYGNVQIVYTVLAILVFWLFLYWPLRTCLRLKVRIWTVVWTTLAMLAVPLAAPLLDLLVRMARHVLITRYDYYAYFVSSDLRDFVGTVVVAFVGAFVFDQLTYIGIRLVRHHTALRFFHSRGRWLVFGVFFLLSLPLGRVTVAPSQGLAEQLNLATLARHIDDILPYFLAFGSILLLRELDPEDKFVFPRKETRSIGALLFAFFLTGRTANLLFIPVPVLLGWWLFRRFAITDRNQMGSRPDNSGDAILAFLDYKRTLPLVEGLRETTEGKFKKAEISLAEYHSRVQDVASLSQQASSQVPKGEEQAREQIFGFGPEPGPWQNAMKAVRYGVIVSLPFQYFDIKGFNLNLEDPYFHLQFASRVMFSLSFWAILSFLFGYFFHVLRGRDGLQKGLVFFLATIVPTIPQRLLGADPLFKGAHLAQIFEILAVVLVLGLFVFDLRTLRRSGFQWRDLVLAHGLTRITGYASSVVVTTIVGLAGPALKSVVVDWLGKKGIHF